MFPDSVSLIVSILSLGFLVLVTIGGVVAFRGLAAQSMSTAQGKAIEAQVAQISAQTAQISALEKRIGKLEGTLDALEILLKRYAMHIEINGETVTLVDENSKQARTVQIRIKEA